MRQSREEGTDINIGTRALTYRVDKRSTASRSNPSFPTDLYIKTDHAIALSAGWIEASSPLTSAAGLGGLNR
jgi:hypothetical protein